MRKPSVLSFLITLLLAAAVCIQGEIIRSRVVKDSAGNSLEPGKQYFIQPIKTRTNNGGGLVPAAISILPFCPLGITQTLLPYQPGLPVTFSLPLGITDFIHTYQIVNVEFQSNIWPVCNEFSKLWKVDKSSSKEPPIVIGGSPKDNKSHFKIEEAGRGANTYKFTNIGGGIVGTTPGAWLSAPQLLLTEDTAKTLVVKFKKVDDAATTTTTSTSRVEKLGLRMFPFY